LPHLPPPAPLPHVYSSIQRINEEVSRTSAWLAPLRYELSKAIVGQEHLLERLLVSLLSGGHLLLEGLPGLAKTLAVKTLAAAVRTEFRRIQFTPDMLPADIIGTEIYNPRQTTFEVKQGPIFSSLILADEINRAPAKVQSALLEAMQEKQVTIGERTFALPELFLVLATQNPIEQEGTYPLPEAQIDRFMLKVVVGYPSRAEERRILDTYDDLGGGAEVTPVAEPADILAARRVVNTIYMDGKIKDYIVALVHATREPQHYQLELGHLIDTGASPRASSTSSWSPAAWPFSPDGAMSSPTMSKPPPSTSCAIVCASAMRPRPRASPARTSSERSLIRCRCREG
jgi:MoxR-like ATPase